MNLLKFFGKGEYLNIFVASCVVSLLVASVMFSRSIGWFVLIVFILLTLGSGYMAFFFKFPDDDGELASMLNDMFGKK